MTLSVQVLEDGTKLQRKGCAWFDPESQRYVEHDRLPGYLTVPDTDPPEIVRPITGATSTRSTAKTSAKTAAGGDSRERFYTLNAFVDDVARHLTPLEVAVWVVLWRRADARTNVAEVGIQAIGSKLGKSDRAVQRAVEWLIRTGLVERLVRGTKQTGASRYRVEPRPQSRLSAVEQAAVLRAGGRKPRPTRAAQPAKRDRLGKFST